MHFHILGIAGAGVSALASVLLSQGHTVTGTDEGVYPPVSTYLDRLGIAYSTRFAASNVPPRVDRAIIGTSASLTRDANPELAELVARGVPMANFAEWLGEATTARENVVIAGSFGKSSLTALVTWLLRASGGDPGHFIGAVPLNLPVTGHWGRDPAFVMEADEYVVSLADRRSKFDLYAPTHTLISSLIHDHVNMFPTMADYVAPFARLIARTPAAGTLVCARGFAHLDTLLEGRAAVRYGLAEGPGWGARAITYGETTRFEVIDPSGRAHELQTQLLGRHSIENIVGACALLVETGLADLDRIAPHVPAFRGVARRLDRKTLSSAVPCYEGFGSSFEKARSAIEAIALHFPGRRQIVVFEPHTFSWRSADALAWYDTVFEGVEEVLLLPPPAHGAASHTQLTSARIAERIAGAGVTVHQVGGAEATLELLDTRLRGDEVVLLLSSGPLDGLAERLPPWLDARFG
jgi:UDP-N-acetylmuramate: L-alanyl-gamma-D-glutamyl-meso-diaminopimelate ligase